MINYITEIIRHILTLYFGVFVTTAIIGIKNNKKNFLIVNCFCILDLLLHMICSMLKSSSHVLNAAADTSAITSFADIHIQKEPFKIAACSHNSISVLSD